MVLLLYFVAALIGSLIPVNTGDRPSGEIEIFLRTNGIHTDYVFPLRNEIFDWTEWVDPAHTASARNDFQYVAIGWGDLEFYRRTPQWSDLRFPIAARAVFLPGASALHVQFYSSLRWGQPMVPLSITKDEYLRLVQFVTDSFKARHPGDVTPVPGLRYNRDDVFYPADRSLHFFYTCNTWVNQGLKRSGLRACLWTPFDDGIFLQYH